MLQTDDRLWKAGDHGDDRNCQCLFRTVAQRNFAVSTYVISFTHSNETLRNISSPLFIDRKANTQKI